MISGRKIVEKIKKYHNNFDEELVLRAYDFAQHYHKSQIRSSGEPYFSHPVAVATILTELKLDSASVVTALLHDTVEDTDATLEMIEEIFGEEISSLVDGVTKLTKIESLSSSKKAAENFRKLVMAMSQDIRVLLVKLADRLHNMRTIDFIKSKEKRIRISNESLAIYAPLAARIGAYKIRDELQELSFEQIQPEAMEYIVSQLQELKAKKKDIIGRIISGLKKKISPHVKDFEIYGREKKPYSIWMKMKNKKVGFYHLYDIMAFRIVVDDIASCYQVLGIINSNYSMIPDTFKDYISTPKENGYKSIHLGTLGPKNKKIEIQIRTKQMHEVAELGVAAHWSYKQNIKAEKESEQYKWIRELINLFENSAEASEVLQNHKIQMHKDQVFCFTPNGDVFNLQNGATIVDFAYAIHSEIGDSCSGAKINGAIVPLRKKLSNGDQIEIIAKDGAKPSPNWLQFVTTSKAKSAIRHFIRNEKHDEYKALGRAIINKFFSSKGLEIDDKLLTKVLDRFNKKTVEEIYILVAEGLISRYDILKAVYPDYEEDEEKAGAVVNDRYSVAIDGLIPGMAMHLAGCCHPIPGDDIIGIINIGSGVTIHNQTCQTLKEIAINPKDFIDVCWKNNAELTDRLYASRIKISVENQFGSLADVSAVIAKQKVNITNIKIINRSSDFFEIIIDVEVRDVDHLEMIISALGMSEKVMEVGRHDS